MIEINDGKQLEAWLNDQPREVAIAIGVRAALRVAPLAADWVEVNPAEHFTDLILPLFRATASPWFTGTWPNQSAAIIASASAASFASAADSAASFAAADDDPTIWAADSTIWVAVTADATAIESSNNAGEMIRLPLWAEGVPGLIGERWARLKALLLALDEDWEVWTAWYEDRLYSAARPLIEKLELARVLIADEDWDKGAKHVNGLIAELEADFRATPPPQRPAIIQVAYGEDDKLHLVPPSPPSARDAAQANRQRAAWAAHSEQLAGLENLDPGRNSPAFGHALQCYRDALGESFETLEHPVNRLNR